MEVFEIIFDKVEKEWFNLVRYTRPSGAVGRLTIC